LKIEIRLMGIFEEAFGSERVSFAALMPRKLGDVIKDLAESSPRLKRVLIDPELLDPRPNAVILVNRKEIAVLQGLETEVKGGDEIVLIPVTHGG